MPEALKNDRKLIKIHINGFKTSETKNSFFCFTKQFLVHITATPWISGCG